MSTTWCAILRKPSILLQPVRLVEVRLYFGATPLLSLYIFSIVTFFSVRASPVPNVVRGSFVVKFFSCGKILCKILFM